MVRGARGGSQATPGTSSGGTSTAASHHTTAWALADLPSATAGAAALGGGPVALSGLAGQQQGGDQQDGDHGLHGGAPA